MRANCQPNKWLATEIQELLEIEPKWRLRPSEGRKILQVVFNSIKTALLRGESVHVRGFGTFKVVERTHRPTPNNILANDSKGRPVAFSSTPLLYKPRKVVIFKPSIPLRAMMNLDSPNFEERRSQQLWSMSYDR